ncbi:hypothetical protein [Ferrovibrio terrae]|uniref:hypothetical protein n=1 Tax=Ferrovibrio terrae TaxID=2594003 RepID=UPI0031376EC6
MTSSVSNSISIDSVQAITVVEAVGRHEDRRPEQQAEFLEALKAATAERPTTYKTPAQRTIPRVEPTKVTDLSPEEQAMIRTDLASSYARLAEHYRIMDEADNRRVAIAKGPDNINFSARNVADLTLDETKEQIQYITDMIQSGEAEQYTLHASNGDRSTSNYRQYVYWMQQHLKELGGAAPTSLGQY